MTNEEYYYMKGEDNMGIEGGWWSLTLETEYETCPECGGSGKDNATLDWKCWGCNGIGRIKVSSDKKER